MSQSSASIPLIDRFLARLGARSLVRIRPGMGWLLLDAIPAVLWMQITGAQSLDGYYLVQLLRHYGADDRLLPLLPLMGFLGTAIGAGTVFFQHDRDPKHGCLRMVWPGRSIFLGTVLWPPLAWALGLGTGSVLAGVLCFFFFSQVLQISGGAYWIVWTQGFLPPSLVGRFHAWRSIAAFLVTAAALQLVSWTYPGRNDPSFERNWLMIVYGCATLVGLLGAYCLQRAPANPPPATSVSRPPLLKALTHQPGIRRLLGWSAVNAAVTAVSMAYLPRWLDSCGLHPDRMALGQSLALIPALLISVLLVGWSWNRIGGARGLLMIYGLLVATDASYLLLSPTNAGWLLFPVLALAGLGRGAMSVGGLSRMQELFPGGDPRVPAVAMGLGGMGGALAALAMMAVFPAFENLRQIHPSLPAVPWLFLAGGLAIRLLALPLVLPPRKKI
jgi:hypothetical protein